MWPVARRDTYEVRIETEGQWWVAHVDGIGATQSQVHLGDPGRDPGLVHMVRDLIATMTDGPPPPREALKFLS